ncbi:MAG: hypothetical protein EPN46_13935 [Candidimonas sp.]|nr:MAG: hypothetical protein EPN77_09265 [Candidimonas sp.]TAM22794.1 MAG: hypothetical protein EPN62_10970 [Candidimonas sp.]TAM73686.1 MAG: hypothetical protein EPN46_13935 [Candidimonas sp.]
MKATSVDNALQIELLRVHAALERQALRRQIRQLGEALKPAALLHEALPALSGKGTWRLLKGLNLARRYPLLISAASTMLIGRKRRNWLRIGAVVWFSWQALRTMKAPRDRRTGE